ncbi:MAG TPA: acetyl-CoA carboxylase biotin carboxylase subunit, partial [Anaerolineae bacterium]|nr:acetyl-CoA carboxylase biotin carboxylase subunit [Anaerolineae bacterium]
TGAGEFYMLEMNTRLQVEHPVTEFVTGVDIAKWQIRIAAGERLTLAQSAIAQRGHAIECRIYAEDPANHFLPSIGTITYCHFPTLPNVRIDSGIASGSVVTTFYDPMLAKVIVYGQDRAEAIARMVAALEQTVIIGVTTNIAYLLAILQEAHFVAGETSTDYLAHYFAGWLDSAEPDTETLLAIAAFELFNATQSVMDYTETKTMPDIWHNDLRWRNVA